MKTILSRLAILVCLAVATSASAVVGYYNLPIYPGANLIANKLISGNDTLDGVLSSTLVPDGSIFTMWDPVANQFMPLSTYSSLSHTWSINYSFSYSQGGLFYSPSPWTNTFVGQVAPYLPPDIGTSTWQPNYPNSLRLISAADPLSGPIDTMFTNVTGRLPLDGEKVEILNPATQTSTITTFQTGSGWDNGDPSLGVGESAWFNLGPVDVPFPTFVVPEPSTFALAGLGATALLVSVRRKRQRVKP